MNKLLTLLVPALLGGLIACSGGGSGNASGGVSVTVRAAFQKEVWTPSGPPTSTTQYPARYCYAEFRDASTQALINPGGFLDGNGTGTFQIPNGSNVYAVIYARWAVPGSTSGSPAFMEGFTVNAVYGTAFGSTNDWYVTSNSFVADTSGTLTVIAQDDANRLAGAFNIADQGVTFALGMRSLLPAGSELPSVAMYWNTSTVSTDQARVYPNAIFNGSNVFMLDGRGLFQAGVMGNASGAANTEQDEWDDGTLGETYAHLLFAPYSYKFDGSSSLSYLRTDTENIPFIPLAGPSEPSMAFTAGFCDFLSAAFRGNPQILDSYRDSGGALRVQNENLSAPNNTLTEFSRYGVAGSLWSMWQQALGANQAGLKLLFNDTLSSRPALDSVGDYTGAPLGSFPTYLVGLRADSNTAWSACQTAFGAWGVSNPTNLYFTGTNLWTNEPIPFTATGSLTYPQTPTYLANAYGKAGAALYRFTQGASTSRTITLTPSSQDMELDLLGPNGLDTFVYAPVGTGARSITQTLAPGDYVIRVRMNPSDTTLVQAAGSYSYSLSLN